MTALLQSHRRSAFIPSISWPSPKSNQTKRQQTPAKHIPRRPHPTTTPQIHPPTRFTTVSNAPANSGRSPLTQTFKFSLSHSKNPPLPPRARTTVMMHSRRVDDWQKGRSYPESNRGRPDSPDTLLEERGIRTGSDNRYTIEPLMYRCMKA